MTHDQFEHWVKSHIEATGAEPARLSELLFANEEIICDEWQATLSELCECSHRLIAGGRVPQFPAEHTNAIHQELVALRAETERARRVKRDREAARTETPPRREGCDFFGVCCGGKDYPACQDVQRRWKQMLAEGETRKQR